MTLNEVIKQQERIINTLKSNIPFIEDRIKQGLDTEDDLVICTETIKEQEQLVEWLKELKSFKEGQKSKKDFIETVLSVAINFELDEFDVALYLVKRGIKLDDFKYNNDRYNYFKEFFEVHGLLKGAENG